MNIDNKKNSETILVIVVGLVLFYFLFKNKSYSHYFLVTALSIGLIQLIVPRIGALIVKLWFKIAEVLGWINTRILLSLVFYFILFPISIMYRLSTKNSLQKKKPSGSVFIERNHLFTKEDLENTW